AGTWSRKFDEGEYSMHTKRYLLLFLTIASAIGTLISGFFLLAQQNEYVLGDADRLEGAQVRAEIRGMAKDGRFLQPMLEVALTKRPSTLRQAQGGPSSGHRSFWPLTVVIPQGLVLSASSDTADVVVLQTQKVTLLRGEQTTEVFAYSLDYSRSFPDSRSQYQPQAPISEDVRGVLNNIVALQAEHEIASQMAVWLVYNQVEIEKIGEMLGRDFSEYGARVNEIVGSGSGAVGAASGSRWSWATVASLSCALLTLCFGTLFLSRLGKKTPQEGRIKVKRLIDQLTDWQLVSRGEITEVWSAFDKRAGKNQPVVVKFPRSDSSGVSPRNIHYRFEKGIEHLQEMTHEHIAQLIESGECLHPREGHETLYLIQEFVDGSTLDEILQERNYESLDTLSVMQIVAQLSQALKGIHQKEVVYRNLTLNNIMVDKSGQVYLTDFANTTLFDSSETGDIGLSPVGTSPFYAPPELIGNVPARDYYSLAMLIVAMYVGKPITGLTWQEVKNDLEYLYQNLKGVPKSVRSVLEWCLNVGYHKVSTEIGHDFSSPRQLLATMVEDAQNQ
ncbi:MAG: protein kinase domain-containing protein, partial [Ardenticatenaceae bacterium]